MLKPYIYVLDIPVPGLEDIQQVLADIDISISNIASERGYARLYRMPARFQTELALLYMYRKVIASWINESGATNFITPAELLNVLAEAENIRKTCECYPYKPD